eukprot:Anaeramoba_flamelloidesa328884_69.p1 GENE.a328884_69~~a328884_69.p1  ORF type:complete len:419 (-),score=112.74 a328884_69:759-1892(-)
MDYSNEAKNIKSMKRQKLTSYKSISFNKDLKKKNEKKSPQLTKVNTLMHKPQLFESMEREQNLCHQVSLVILSIVEEFIIKFKSQLIKEDFNDEKSIFKKIFMVLTILSEKNQSDNFDQHLFYVYTILVENYKDQIFNQNNELLKKLSIFAFMKSISNNKQTRAYSNSFLYLLLKTGFLIANNFNYIKIQLILGFSNLVGDVDKFKDDRHTRHTLKILKLLGMKENNFKIKKRKVNNNSFQTEINNHCQNMFSILKDSVKLRDNLNDPEVESELLYNIAKEYKNAPQLRITWLENLIKFHKNNNSPTEAGITMIHLASLITEYLYKMANPSTATSTTTTTTKPKPKPKPKTKPKPKPNKKPKTKPKYTTRPKPKPQL